MPELSCTLENHTGRRSEKVDYRSLVSHRRITELLQDLVRIPSVNPDFPGGTGEAGVAVYVERFFRNLGLPVSRQEVEAERWNVVGALPGSNPHRTLLLEAHMDTVQVNGMTIDPFEPRVSGGRLYGRGSCDTKASLTAMMAALEILHTRGLKPPVSVHLAAVVDEETTFKGVSRIAEQVQQGQVRYEAGIVGEPTELEVVVAHKGCVRFQIRVQGVASHTSKPHLGVNAIDKMTEVLAYLKSEVEPRYAANTHPLVGPPTHCVSLIQGGVAPNTVPESCTITVDRRTVPGEDSYAVWQALKADVESLNKRIPDLHVTVEEPFVVDWAMEVDPAERVVDVLCAASRRYGASGRPVGVPYGTDASKLTRAGVPCVVFGPGNIQQAHTKDEWVEIEQVVQATAVLLEAILNYA